MGFLVDRVRELGLSPTLRLGLAHPVAGGAHRHLHPRDYPAVGERILGLARRAGRAGIAVRFDCGFVPCMFPPGSLPDLGGGAEDIGCRCSPIPDVLPQGQAIACFPLAGLHREAVRDRDASTLRPRFHERYSPYRSLGLCGTCQARDQRTNGKCEGGCLAAAMRRLYPQTRGREQGPAAMIDVMDREQNDEPAT